MEDHINSPPILIVKIVSLLLGSLVLKKTAKFRLCFEPRAKPSLG